MLTNIKKFLSGLIVTGVTFIFLLALSEILIRALGTESDNLIMQDPVLGWVHIPNKKGYSRNKEFAVRIRTNKDGFIGRDYSYSKPENTIRILTIGDSLTEAFQVSEEDSYSRLLENNLKNNFKDTAFEVLNMGIAGYGTQREYYVFKNVGLKFKPEIAILGFFTGNDFSDNMDENIDPGASFSKYREIKNRIKLFVRNHSVAWRFILRKKSKNKVLAYLLDKNVRNTNNKPDNDNGKDSQPDTKKLLDRSSVLIKNIQELADDNDMSLIVAILPSSGQAYNESKDKNTDELQRGLISFLEKERINYVDLLPYFKNWAKINPDEKGYYALDGHPNAYGHSIIAEGIGEYLSEFLRKKNGNF